MAMITKAEFEARFTIDELVSIKEMANGNMTAIGWMVLFDMCDVVDPDFLGLRHVLMWFASQGVLDEYRIAEVLA